jgi:ABC-type glycerol-3-phosphate transport system substrate-binding protein
VSAVRRVLLLIAAAGCGGESTPPAPIKFLHTFGPEETELFNATMADHGIAVEAKLAPFARGQQVIGEILRAGTNCPDLIRIDATWLPGLVAHDLLLPVPAELSREDWLPEVEARMGVPQTIDGLIVLRDEAAPAPKTSSIADLVAAARAAAHSERPHPLELRADGYWFVPWLRGAGSDLDLEHIRNPGAVDALAQFAALFGDAAPAPPPSGSEAPEELRHWLAHDTAYWVTGPWQVGALRDRERLQITALAGAPRGGQMLVVPRCAKDPAAGWRLAGELTSVPVETKFAEAFATVPTRASALAAAPALVQAEYQALRGAEPLAHSPVTPLLFDDLNPAIAAVIAHDATAQEAIDGVRRGWERLARRPTR